MQDERETDSSGFVKVAEKYLDGALSAHPLRKEDRIVGQQDIAYFTKSKSLFTYLSHF